MLKVCYGWDLQLRPSSTVSASPYWQSEPGYARQLHHEHVANGLEQAEERMVLCASLIASQSLCQGKSRYLWAVNRKTLPLDTHPVFSSRPHIPKPQRTRQLQATESLVSSLNPDAESISSPVLVEGQRPVAGAHRAGQPDPNSPPSCHSRSG